MAGRGPWQLAAGLARAARFPYRRRDQPGIRELEARRAGASGHRRLEARRQRAIPASPRRPLPRGRGDRAVKTLCGEIE